LISFIRALEEYLFEADPSLPSPCNILSTLLAKLDLVLINTYVAPKR
jgi:hypothetical protein